MPVRTESITKAAGPGLLHRTRLPRGLANLLRVLPNVHTWWDPVGTFTHTRPHASAGAPSIEIVPPTAGLVSTLRKPRAANAPVTVAVAPAGSATV